VPEGPARQVFARQLPGWPQTALADAIDDADWVLCGTSWQSPHELHALRLAREKGRPTAVFLDHWANYRERFRLDGDWVYPDQLLVGDSAAEAIARREIPGVSVARVGNPYLDDIRDALAAAITRTASGRPDAALLYVCEPIREHALKQHGDERHWGYTEEEALEFFLHERHRLGLQDREVLLRPHPAEPAGKYDWAAAAPGVRYASGRTLAEDVVACAMVAHPDCSAGPARAGAGMARPAHGHPRRRGMVGSR
jgi:hypothetical protein